MADHPPRRPISVDEDTTDFEELPPSEPDDLDEDDALEDEPAGPAGDADDEAATGQEPVVIAHAVTVVLASLVTAGWVVIPSTTINAIGTIIAVLLSTIGALTARQSVYTKNSVRRIRRQAAAWASRPARLTPELAALVQDEVDAELYRRFGR